MFDFLNQNDLISPAQSGFQPADSCINQLFSITHEIYHSMDKGYENRGVFLDISKVFDKVWHEGLVFKLKQNGISGNLLNIFEDFLRNRKQRVHLNGQTCNWENIHAGVPQDSILGPLLISINDLAENLSSNPKLFADDTPLFSVVRDLNTSAIEINDDLKKIEAWSHQWKMSFNPDPLKQAQEVIFSRKRNKSHHPDIILNDNPVKKVLTKNIWVCFLIVNLILIIILKEYLRKLVNLLALSVNSEIFYRNHPFYKSINSLLDLI